MDAFSIRIDSPPKTKGRPRLGRRRKAYTPAETIEAEAVIRDAYVAASGPTFDGPVNVDIEYDKLGQTITISTAAASSKMRGDIDNMVKLTLDALQPAAFANDKQVQRITASKH